MQRTPATFVLAELQRRYPSGPHGSWARLLADRDRQTWRDLHTALHLAYHALVDGSAARARQGYQAELAWRSRNIAEFGIRAALSGLHPSITWDGTVLQINAGRNWALHPAAKD